MDSIGCLNNITYPGPTEYSMYKCQNFGTARQTAPAPAGQRGDDPIVARTASFTATAACNAPYGTIRTSAPPFECARGHLRAFTPARTLAWQRSNSHAKTHVHARAFDLRSRLGGVNDALGSNWPARKLPVDLADRAVCGRVPAQGMQHAQTYAYTPPPSGVPYRKWVENAIIASRSMDADLGEAVTVQK